MFCWWHSNNYWKYERFPKVNKIHRWNIYQVFENENKCTKNKYTCIKKGEYDHIVYINLRENQIEQVDKFMFLGSTISNDERSRREIIKCIC